MPTTRDQLTFTEMMFLSTLFLASMAAASPSGTIVFNDVKADYQVSSEGTVIKFTVTMPRVAWLGIGVSADGTMTSGAGGSDAFICSNGVVQRYWITAYATPTNGTDVIPPTCTQADGVTQMSFSRYIDAQGDKTRAIATSGNTNFIFAYGNDVALAYHANRGSVPYPIF